MIKDDLGELLLREQAMPGQRRTLDQAQQLQTLLGGGVAVDEL